MGMVKELEDMARRRGLWSEAADLVSDFLQDVAGAVNFLDLAGVVLSHVREQFNNGCGGLVGVAFYVFEEFGLVGDFGDGDDGEVGYFWLVDVKGGAGGGSGAGLGDVFPDVVRCVGGDVSVGAELEKFLRRRGGDRFGFIVEECVGATGAVNGAVVCCVSHGGMCVWDMQRSVVETMPVLSFLAGSAVDTLRYGGESRRVEILLDHLRSLVRTVEAKDMYTYEHSTRVAKLSMSIARVMGCSEEFVERVGRLAYLHDVGKVGVPLWILQKKGKLNEREMKAVRLHPSIGLSLVSTIPLVRSEYGVIGMHHERYDGEGYPFGLGGEDIPLSARIVCVADAFDAMTSDRPYRNGLPFDVVRSELLLNSGTQFDLRVVDAFLEYWDGRSRGGDEEGEGVIVVGR